MRLIYSLKHDEKLPLSRILNDLNLSDVSLIKHEIESKLFSFFKKYKVQPLTLSFSVPHNEYILNIDHSYIGNLVFKDFVIKILPKHFNVSTEKILKLAAYLNMRDAILGNSEFFRDEIGDDDSINSLEFFYDLFLDKVNVCIRNGLAHGFVLNKDTSTNFRGVLDVNKFMINPTPRNIVHQIIKVRTPDLPINRVIKSVILDIIGKTKKSELLIKSKTILRNLSEVGLFDLPVFFKKNDFIVNSRRNDYDEILDLIEVLVNGFDPDASSEIGFIPEYIINLDYLFEKSCFLYLKRIMNEKYFNVQYQLEHNHIFSDLKLSGKIIPDIVLSKNKDDFKNDSIILDAKNKISGAEDAFRVSTADIYQLFFYSKILKTKYVFLLYPGIESNYSRYPLKGSQGDAAYNKARQEKINKMYETNQIVDFENTKFILWRINLEGSLKDTLSSFNELSNLLSEIMIYDDLSKK